MNAEDSKNQPKTSQQQPAQPGTTDDSQNNPTQTGENKSHSQDTPKKSPSQGSGQPQENVDKSAQDKHQRAS